jgi:hypothetical protein
MGLISHFGLPHNRPTFERAVLVKHGFHTAVLMLRDEDFAEPLPAVDLPRIKCPKAKSDERVQCYSLARVQLRFNGLDKGLLNGTPSPIDVHIPKLTSITDSKTKTPKKFVEKADVKSGHAFGYIDYTGGCLIAPIYARTEMKWLTNGCKSSSGPSCVTPDVLYAGKTIKPFVTVEIVQPAGHRPFRLKPNAFVVVEVIPEDGHGSLDDFKQYLSLMDKAKCISEMHEVIVDGAPQECPAALPMPCLRTSKPLDIRYLDSLSLGQLIQRYDLQAGCTNSSGGPPF